MGPQETEVGYPSPWKDDREGLTGKTDAVEDYTYTPGSRGESSSSRDSRARESPLDSGPGPSSVDTGRVDTGRKRE